jgi:hypothetical protein
MQFAQMGKEKTMNIYKTDLLFKIYICVIDGTFCKGAKYVSSITHTAGVKILKMYIVVY